MLLRPTITQDDSFISPTFAANAPASSATIINAAAIKAETN